MTCNDFFPKIHNNPLPLKFPSIKQPVCRIQINGQGTGWTTICDDRSFYRPPGMVIDLLISVILYWYILLRNIAHSSLDSGVITLSAGHSDHSYLFHLHSATLQDAAPSQTNRTLFITEVLFIPPVTKIPQCILSTACLDILHAGSTMCHVLRTAVTASSRFP